MPYGYTGKILHVDLSNHKIDVEEKDEVFYRSYLGGRGIASLLVEGGSRLLTAMIEGRFADKIFLSISPRLIGGAAAPSLLEGEGVRRVQESWEINPVSTFTIGTDFIIEGYF